MKSHPTTTLLMALAANNQVPPRRHTKSDRMPFRREKRGGFRCRNWDS